MPDPRTLKVGDLVRFVKLPDEWADPNYFTHPETRAFMKRMIKRAWPSRVAWIDKDGYPWIEARMRQRGRLYYHSYGIYRSTGWRRVKRRNST